MLISWTLTVFTLFIYFTCSGPGPDSGSGSGSCLSYGLSVFVAPDE